MMKIKVNGTEQSLNQDEARLLDILQKSNVTKPEMVSVQLNGKFLDRELFAGTMVKDQDEVEFLYFMGGGQRQPLLAGDDRNGFIVV